MEHKESESPVQSRAVEKLFFLPRKILDRWRKVVTIEVLIITIGVLLAIAIRLTTLNSMTLDYFASLKPWYNTIRSQGFSVFATDFSTYNPPYLYLLYLIARFFPDTPVVAAVKLPSLIADFVMAYFVYRIVQIKYPKGLIPISAGMAVLFAPTVVLNSGFWGQADSLFTAGLVACLFFLLVEKQGLAMLAFGIALAFKLQAIFIAPLLFALLLRKAIPWRFFLIIPAILALALIPAWIAGRPIPDLLNIYLFQTSQFELLTMNAPSLYAWLPSTKQVFNLFYIPGVIFGGIAAYCLFLIALKAPEKLKREAIVELTLLSMVLIPFSLPKMHERYFYPADVISIAFAFYYPQLYYIPILIGGVSFFAYEPYLFNVEQIPMPILTAALLITICILTYNTMKRLYRPELPPRSNPPIEPDSPAAADQTAEEA